ncbi:MAG: RNA 2'-phosphotransferase [Saprospiraceae bacterium]|nr:RNA 2'-phosphotransferase [Saprospiraceae bacterium]
MKDLVNSSKLIALVLRHRPDKIGLSLDQNGWASTDELLHKLNEHGHRFDLDLLKSVVENNDKKRFIFSKDLTKIRANQGHSVDVDLGLAPKDPPTILYHGTAEKFINSIQKSGLVKGSRQHVHLSADLDTARKVGSRHGTPVVLTVHSGEMRMDGHSFFQSENGVWLTESVPVQYLGFPDDSVKR